MRCVCLLGGGVVPEVKRGTRSEGIAHVTDWLPTMMHAASGNPSALEGVLRGKRGGEVQRSKRGPGRLDGHDLWPALMLSTTLDGSDLSWPRKEVLLNPINRQHPKGFSRNAPGKKHPYSCAATKMFVSTQRPQSQCHP